MEHTTATVGDGEVTARPACASRAVGITKIYGRGETAVTALDAVSVEFAASRFTAVMGPSGSGKSTLLHCMAGLDRVSSGEVWIGQTELSRLSERELTVLRRDQVGFVFQAFNLLPTLTAAENIELPLAIAGRKADRAWYDRVVDAVALRGRRDHRPRRCPAANSNASRPPARWPPGRPSSSPTSPPETWTPARARRSCASCAAQSTSSARPS
jgi:putative ABC transport system ATP-binding protein